MEANTEGWTSERVARAINSHVALVEALANLVAILPDPELDSDDVQRGYVIAAREALALAGETP